MICLVAEFLRRSRFTGKRWTVMTNFVEQLRLAERAAEDIYFARVNGELIKSLHERIQAESNSFLPSEEVNAEARAEESPVVMDETLNG